MIILFILIVLGLISATISYYKAFKVNNRILYTIDKFEGYNDLAKDEINQILSAIGYTGYSGGTAECPKRNGVKSIASSDKYLYCVYYYYDDRGQKEIKEHLVNGQNRPIYYNYSVVTYLYVDLPLVQTFKVPVHTKGERIYNFSDGQDQKGA